jgi:hypothetical protein
MGKFIELAASWVRGIVSLRDGLQNSTWKGPELPKILHKLYADVVMVLDIISESQSPASSTYNAASAAPPQVAPAGRANGGDFGGPAGPSSGSGGTSGGSSSAGPSGAQGSAASGGSNMATSIPGLSYVGKGKERAVDPQPTKNYIATATGEDCDGEKTSTTQSPPQDEPFGAGSAPKTYIPADVLAATDTDILKGTGAYHVSAITDIFLLKAVYSHPSFLKLVSTQQANLMSKVYNKTRTTFEDIRLLRLGCAYITESAKQKWFNWKYLNDTVGLLQFSNAMTLLLKEHLSTSKLTDHENNHEAMCLGKEIQKMRERLDGVMEAPATPRVFKPMRGRRADAA